jgi:hypothetical protein
VRLGFEEPKGVVRRYAWALVNERKRIPPFAALLNTKAEQPEYSPLTPDEEMVSRSNRSDEGDCSELIALGSCRRVFRYSSGYYDVLLVFTLVYIGGKVAH